MNVLSLFDGISCGQVALYRANISVENYFASEVDRYAMAVTQKNFPNTMQLGCVTTVKANNLPKIDLLIGGSPCQGFSYAGKMLNFNDERSKLFFEYARILRELRVLNPDIKFLLENVVMKQEWQDVISQELGVAPVLINSSLVSAQNRRRLYWTNIDLSQLSIVDKGFGWKDVMEHDAQNVYYVTPKMSDWIRASTKRIARFKVYTKDSAEKMQMLEASHYKGISNQRCFAIEDSSGLRYISARECERLQTLPDDYTALGIFPPTSSAVSVEHPISNTQRYKQLGNCWTVDVIAEILKQLQIVHDLAI